MENRIPNPFSRGQQVVLPAGTVVNRPTRPVKPGQPRTSALGRPVKTLIHSVRDGWVKTVPDRVGDRIPTGLVILPEITYAGAGGYWVDVRVTPELCATLGVDMPDLPILTDAWHDRLDQPPAYGPGHDNRLTVPAEAT